MVGLISTIVPNFLKIMETLTMLHVLHFGNHFKNLALIIGCCFFFYVQAHRIWNTITSASISLQSKLFGGIIKAFFFKDLWLSKAGFHYNLHEKFMQPWTWRSTLMHSHVKRACNKLFFKLCSIQAYLRIFQLLSDSVPSATHLES